MGSDFWPLTPEGRVLALLLSIFGLAIYDYITASFATFFVGQEAAASDGDIGGSREIANLRAEIAALREDLPRPVSEQTAAPGAPTGESAAFDFGDDPSSGRLDS